MNTFTTRFAGFEFSGTQVSAYIFSIDTFVISLKDGRVVRFTTDDPELFERWLQHHGARNINDKVGSMIYNFYFEE